MPRLICEYCKQEFISPYNGKKFCCRACYNVGRFGEKRTQETRDKIANALRGKPCSEERKQNISQARLLQVDQQTIESLKSIWKLQYITDANLVINRANVDLSGRVYYRLVRQNKDFFVQYPPLKFLPNSVQQWSQEKMREFLEDAQKIYTVQLPQKYQIHQKTVERILKHFQIPKIVKPPRGFKDTKPEKFIESILNDLEIKFKKQFPLGVYFFDFAIGKLLIEVHGDYWHCNPQIYSAPINQMQKRNILNDVFKKGFAEKQGYRVIVIWENDIKQDKEKIIWYLKNEIWNWQ